MLTVDELMAAVRVHSDRVHDAVRRLGCPPDQAVQVVQTSALELVDAVAADTVSEPVGWWFARARALGRAATTAADDLLPVGGGVLGGDANQVRLAEALESRPERDRAALLLRDSYDLPATAVATVLNTDTDAAMQTVGAARLEFLPALLGGSSLSLAGHAVDLAALSRLAEGGPLAARDATTWRHVQSCGRCADVLDAQERARRMLSGLTVVALPDVAREQVLATTQARADALLPLDDAVLMDDEDDEDEPRRGYSLSLIALGLVVAVAAGVGIGIVISRGKAVSPTAAVRGVPVITQAPVLAAAPRATASPTPTPSVPPTPRVYVITPSPTPEPTATETVAPSATPTVSQEPLTLSLDPSSGPNDSTITVSGTGWTPGQPVQVEYVTSFGATGSSSTVVADERGRFTTQLTAHDPQNLPGPHDVRADDGTHQQTATFTSS